MTEPWSAADAATFKRMCTLLCTPQETASLMGITEDELREKVTATYGEDHTLESVTAIFAAEGKRNLRAAQMQSALNGNTTMQIWLGKQYLGQSDAPQQIEISSNTRKAEVTPLEVIRSRHAERRAPAKDSSSA